MDPTRFDELTKALASSTSRRQALRRIGGILGGTALASLLPGRVLASGGGNSTCAHFCNAVFGADSPAADQCISQAAHKTGLCYECGPLSQCVQAGGIPLGGACSCADGEQCNCCCGGCFQSVCVECFTAGTLIAMADGTSRPIEYVLVGDLVLGNAGRVNRVTEVRLPLLGQRPLYALNESGYFVTSGHPFMTEEGWKAVDPSAVPPHLSELHVGRLTVGDRLQTLAAAAVPVGAGRSAGAEALDVRIESVALRSLVDRPADPATQLYNLRLDGDHTYFANDLLVHNK